MMIAYLVVEAFLVRNGLCRQPCLWQETIWFLMKEGLDLAWGFASQSRQPGFWPRQHGLADPLDRAGQAGLVRANDRKTIHDQKKWTAILQLSPIRYVFASHLETCSLAWLMAFLGHILISRNQIISHMSSTWEISNGEGKTREGQRAESADVSTNQGEARVGRPTECLA